jgi:hypothetical protein
MTATKPQIPTTRCRLTLTGEIDRAPPALVRDIDRILLDHGIDLPKADIKAALAWLLSGSYGDAIGGLPARSRNSPMMPSPRAVIRVRSLKPIDAPSIGP